jgi:transcription elongation factor Elf1
MFGSRRSAGPQNAKHPRQMATIHKTGLVCPGCKKPVGVIVNILNKNTLVMQCQACDNRWTVTSPGTKPH